MYTNSEQLEIRTNIWVDDINLLINLPNTYNRDNTLDNIYYM